MIPRAPPQLAKSAPQLDTGAEHCPFAGDDDASHPVVDGEEREDVHQLVGHCVCESIVFTGSGEGQYYDRCCCR